MAITTINEPYDRTPAYNPIKFLYNSTNKNNLGFKYIFDVYESGTANKIAEYRVFPRYSDGYGEIDLSKLLQNKVTFNFDPTLTESDPATNSYYKYDLKVGEEYVVTYTYTANLVNNGGNIQITPTTAHTFQVGDQIVLFAGVANSAVNGLWTVIAISGTTNFTINALFANVNNPTDNGTVNYADNRKTITRDIVTTLNKYVFNGALPWSIFREYEENDFILDDAGAKLLTNIPARGGFRVTPQQDLWVNIMNNFDTTGYMVFGNSDGDILAKPITDNALITQVGVGANNYGTLTALVGSTPLIKPTTTWYEFVYTDGSYNDQSQIYRIEIDTRCKIEDFELVFLDRLGSFGSFAFQLRAYEQGNVNKEVYKQDVQGYTSGGMWTYATDEFGSRVINPTVEKTYQLNTNWLTVEMDTYYQELISSPQVYIKIGYRYYACIVQETSFEVARQKNKNLIMRSVSVMLANQDSING
jgi:hypothetical protein